MSNKLTNILLGVVTLLLTVLLGISIYSMKSNSVSVGSAGNLKAENYLPFIMYNNGYNSAKDITTTGTITGATVVATTLSAGATTLSGTLNITTSNTATSTLVVGCIQSYATSTATPVKTYWSATTSTMYTTTGLIPMTAYGTCP